MKQFVLFSVLLLNFSPCLFADEHIEGLITRKKTEESAAIGLNGKLIWKTDKEGNKNLALETPSKKVYLLSAEGDISEELLALVNRKGVRVQLEVTGVKRSTKALVLDVKEINRSNLDHNGKYFVSPVDGISEADLKRLVEGLKKFPNTYETQDMTGNRSFIILSDFSDKHLKKLLEEKGLSDLVEDLGPQLND